MSSPDGLRVIGMHHSSRCRSPSPLLPTRGKALNDFLHRLYLLLLHDSQKRKVTDFSLLSSCLQDGMYKHRGTFSLSPESTVGRAKEERQPQWEQGLDCSFSDGAQEGRPCSAAGGRKKQSTCLLVMEKGEGIKNTLTEKLVH